MIEVKSPSLAFNSVDLPGHDCRMWKKIRKTVLRSVFIILFCVCLLPNEAEAATMRVNTTADTDNLVCINPNLPGCSLRSAISVANQDPGGSDNIEFNIPASDPNCSAGVCTINLASPLPEIRGFTFIHGPGADKLTVKNAANFNAAVFYVSAPLGIIEINGLTINGGNNSQSAARGIYAVSFNTQALIRVNRCVIIGNSAAQGAGIGTSLDMTIRETLVTGNTGIAIYNYGAEMNIINSTIAANTGRGIENELGTMLLVSSTVSNNSSNGIANSGSGAIFRVRSSIIAQNTSQFLPDISGAFVSEGFNLVGKRDGGTGFTAPTDLTGGILAPLNPRLDPGGLKDNGGATKTIALMSNSPAIDKSVSEGLNGNIVKDQRDSPRTFDNPAIQNAAGGNGTDIGALERRNSPYDFDGDGRTDISIYRPSVGEWWYLRSSNGGNYAAQFGNSLDKLVPGDFTGDGRADIAVFRPSTGEWFILRSEDGSYYSFPFGTFGDIPVVGDFDGDGKADQAVFRPSNTNWYIRRSSDGGATIQQFGAGGDVPAVADYDGDGKSDIAIWRASVGQWWIKKSSNASVVAFQFGNSSDKPVQGDYTGDGKADAAIWRPSKGEWFVLRSEDNSFYSVPFGTSGDIPAPGDYDSDGKFDTVVFRPSTQTWYINGSGAGSMILTFGAGGDRPVANAFVP